jgi:hypothetical protein
MSTVTMKELELESAELLPARETLNCYRATSHPGSSVTITQSNGSANGNYDGSGDGGWGFLSGGILDGNANGNLSGNNVAVVL